MQVLVARASNVTNIVTVLVTSVPVLVAVLIPTAPVILEPVAMTNSLDLYYTLTVPEANA